MEGWVRGLLGEHTREWVGGQVPETLPPSPGPDRSGLWLPYSVENSPLLAPRQSKLAYELISPHGQESHR